MDFVDMDFIGVGFIPVSMAVDDFELKHMLTYKSEKPSGRRRSADSAIT